MRTMIVSGLVGFALIATAHAAAGNCAQFTATSHSYIYVTSSSALKLTAPMTMEVWVKPVTGGGEWALILGKQYNPSDANPWYSYRFLANSASSGEKGFPRRVGFNVAPVGTGENGVASTTVVPVNVWTHIAGVYNGTNLTIYINGTPESSTPLTSAVRPSDLGLYIGKAPWTNYNDYNGQMDEIRLWNVARTQTQIQSAMNCSLAGNETGLVAYWPFNDTPGSATADDASPNNHVGTLNNGAAIVAGSTVPVYQTFSCTFQTDGTPGATVNGAATFNQVVREGSNATPVTAAAPLGYAFAGWTGGYAGMVNPLTVTNVVTNLNIVAHFVGLLAAQGTPQAWLAKYGYTNDFDAAEQSDDDGDAFTVGQEYIADTNPTNAASFFHILTMTPGPPVAVTFEPGSTGRVYSFQFADDLTSGIWTNVPGTPRRPGAGSPDTMTDTNVPTRGPFYRMKVDLP